MIVVTASPPIRPFPQAFSGPVAEVSGEKYHLKNAAAFTLLEVLIAVAILAIGFTSLLGSQARSLAYATETQFNNTAPLLAAGKLAEMTSGIQELVDDDGDFGEEYPGFAWKMVVEEVPLSNLEGLSDLELVMLRAELTVTWSDTGFSHTVSYYAPPKE